MWSSVLNVGGKLGVLAAGLAVGGSAGVMGACEGAWRSGGASPDAVDAGGVVIASPQGVSRPPFEFGPEDAGFLDEVQRACVDYFWREADARTGLIPDRTSDRRVVSVAGVGFQLAAYCIGAERGWLDRAAARDRCELILTSLLGNPKNRKAGLFYHFIESADAGMAGGMPEDVVSTVDSALLFAGVMTASECFGGRVRTLGDELLGAADWRFFVSGDEAKPSERGFVSLGWKPTRVSDPTGDGALLPFYWVDSGDEHRLVAFLGVGASSGAGRLGPEMYYALRRQLGHHAGAGEGDGGLMVFFPWSGAHFTNFFAHCWIDYASMGPDEPSRFGAAHRARVDWWENSRRMTRMHRAKCIENPKRFAGFGPDGWGLTASDIENGYGVPGVFPKAVPMRGARAEFDFSSFTPKDDFGDGTLAPYGAGCSILFEPGLAMSAMRSYRGLTRRDGTPLAWRGVEGYGFVDGFHAGTGWSAPDTVAIDHGALVVSIENARSGRVWRWFMGHPIAQRASDALGWTPAAR
ncbi:MAG: hypothetical protein HRU70_09300 [Phycisphaeraceae bacterium]|nr:MAG: hypothetical protein HRU70_09300 [Phycisphaeraceae bacterium]